MDIKIIAEPPTRNSRYYINNREKLIYQQKLYQEINKEKRYLENRNYNKKYNHLDWKG